MGPGDLWSQPQDFGELYRCSTFSFRCFSFLGLMALEVAPAPAGPGESWELRW
jgi:hypothetical protein